MPDKLDPNKIMPAYDTPVMVLIDGETEPTLMRYDGTRWCCLGTEPLEISYETAEIRWWTPLSLI